MKLLSKSASKDRLILAMLKTMHELARTRWVRLDLLVWADKYEKHARRLGVKIEEKT
jgi:hypothetical protein